MRRIAQRLAAHAEDDRAGSPQVRAVAGFDHTEREGTGDGIGRPEDDG